MKCIIYSIIFFNIYLNCGFTQESDNKRIENNPILGISAHTGIFLINGDIAGGGLASGFRIHFPLNHILSLRANAYYGFAKGIGYQPWQHSSVGGGLVESHFEPYRNITGGWYPSYQFQQRVFEIEGLFDILKVISKSLDMEFGFINFYILGSYGLFTKNTSLDLLDKNGLPYQNLTSSVSSGLNTNLSKDRNQIIKNITSIYDGNHETSIVYPGNKTYSYGAGITFNLSKSIALGLEQKFIFYPGVDLIDGIRFRTQLDETHSKDNASYSQLYLLLKI